MIEPLLELEYTGQNIVVKVLAWVRGMTINLLTWPFIRCGVEREKKI